MKVRTIVCSLIVLLALFSLGQVTAWSMPPQDVIQDHENGKSDPVKSGYAVVTPAAAGPGLLVFETFGQSHGSDVIQAGVLPSELVTHAVMFVSTSDRLSRNLGIAFTNPTSSPASIFLTLRDDAGTTVATASLSLAGHHQTAQFVTQLFSIHQSLLRDLTGTVDIVSDIPIAVVGLRFRGANFSTLPVVRLSLPTPVPVISPGIGGPDAVLLPQFAVGGGWASEIVIVNTRSVSMTVRVDLFDPNGLPLTATLNNVSGSSFQNIVIPAGGVITLAPRDQHGDSDF